MRSSSRTTGLLRCGRSGGYSERAAALETDTPTRPAHVTDWRLLVEAAELELESKETVPRFAEQLGRMYDLVLEHLDELRAEMGEKAAERLKEEAETVAPGLRRSRYVFIVTRRPS
jgi:hypothetical protein